MIELEPEAAALQAARTCATATPASDSAVQDLATAAWQAYYDSLKTQEADYIARFTATFRAVEQRLRRNTDSDDSETGQ